MARPKYLLEDFFYDQGSEYMKKSPSGYSVSGAMRKPGEEIEWDGPPAWCMKPVNSEAQAMVEKYPPEEPLHLDEMVERAGAGKDADDRNLIRRPALSAQRRGEDEDEQPSNNVAVAPKKRGRPAKVAAAAIVLALLAFSPMAHADINAGQAGSVLTGNGYGADPTWSRTPTLGVSGLAQGSLSLAGSTSGSVQLVPQAAAGTTVLTLPAVTGNLALASNKTPVACGATCTLTASNSGYTILLNTAAGSVATLPAATGTGNTYKFVVSTTVTSNSHKILAASTSDYLTGTEIGWNGSTAKVFTCGTGSTNHAIQMPASGSTASGGNEGDVFEYTDIAANLWIVQGVYQAGTTPTTPCSATNS
jgi:hypothetical protein